MQSIPALTSILSSDQIDFQKAFAKSCRHSIIAMLKNSQSGHPGGSLSTIDYLSLLYTFVISQTGENVIVSNGHISPAVYSVLAELGYIPKDEMIRDFRKVKTRYEGHITRHVDGVLYGTGPLGIGVSVAAAMAWAEKYNKTGKKVYGIMGDGEAEEGQVHEMILFSNKYKLDNFILFVDYNEVQLTDSLKDVMPIDIPAVFKAGGWEVIDADGHDPEKLWEALGKANNVSGKPVVIVGHTIMGKGVSFMEETGKKHQSTWHGNAPKPDQADQALSELKLSDEEKELVESMKNHIKWHPPKPEFPELLSKVDIDTGEPIVYDADIITDCRSAYGKALLDLAKRNSQIVALSADLRGSVMTKFVAQELPDQHIEVGIAEQNMVSIAGGLSLDGFVPFASTFGAFMSSRAKDQARVNDINKTNVKMVSTHCGLSVGEDGPTHQAIDDMGSFLGMFNTMIIEPADPNQTDHIIRYIASHYGNFYVRMGRHKFPIITKEDGSVFYDKDYVYEYGRSDVIREGSDITIAATGAMVGEAIKALEKMPNVSAEIVAVSSIKQFDQTILDSIKKTKKVVTVEDHNSYSGLGAELSRELHKQGITVDEFKILGIEEYQLSGKSLELYEVAGISADHIAEACMSLTK